ncbi:hypothetical protein UCREL1_2176 [Eutypa lata UCREL1]|uniref:Uncharacterized protein n=1 Tax=Eutypa lata (strain UCR-EL1) TaxID=1287681 RepID=M7TVV8_EUTLA|nr:hypothetical protein UCREL1_2176 [Eutypa lata UCREL1]
MEFGITPVPEALATQFEATPIVDKCNGYLTKYCVLGTIHRNLAVPGALKQSGIEMYKHGVDAELAIVVRIARAHLDPYIAAYGRPDSLA